jgi:hypothetical protein
MPGEYRALPLLRFATAAMRSNAMSRVSDPQRTAGHVGGGRRKLDCPAQSADGVFLVEKYGVTNSFDHFESVTIFLDVFRCFMDVFRWF